MLTPSSNIFPVGNSNVILACQDDQSLKKLLKQNNFTNAIIIKADLEKKEEIEHLLSYITKLKRIKKPDININCVLSAKNNKEINFIQIYTYIIYINISLISFLFNTKIKSYEDILNLVNNLENQIMAEDDEIKKIYQISEYLGYLGNFNEDIINQKLTELYYVLLKNYLC